MKRKSKQFIKKTTNNPIYDLFGEIIVTLHDVYVWVCVATRGRFLGRQKRYDYYVKTWDVVYKVRNYKKLGLFDDFLLEFIEKYDGQAWQPLQLVDN